MRRLTAQELNVAKVKELGLDPSLFDLLSTEAIAASSRRAAGFLCPCSQATLVRAVERSLAGLFPSDQPVRDSVEDAVEAMVSYGDLVEQRDVDAVDGAGGTLLYLGQPSYVRRASGLVLLIGVIPDQRSGLPEHLEAKIQYSAHVRTLPADAATVEELHAAGYGEILRDRWSRCPAPTTAAAHAALHDQALTKAAPSGEVAGLTIISPKASVRYYRGRWTEPKDQTGRFVGRRAQAYGADLWCYVELAGGRAVRFIDLPRSGGRGCDEAWHLQMALDTISGTPQVFRVRSGVNGSRIFDFFSPVPAWAQRQWDVIGEPVPNTGCLLAYQFTDKEAEEERRFARERLWLREL